MRELISVEEFSSISSRDCERRDNIGKKKS